MLKHALPWVPPLVSSKRRRIDRVPAACPHLWPRSKRALPDPCDREGKRACWSDRPTPPPHPPPSPQPADQSDPLDPSDPSDPSACAWEDVKRFVEGGGSDPLTEEDRWQALLECLVTARAAEPRECPAYIG
jgi:hypothetical protein